VTHIIQDIVFVWYNISHFPAPYIKKQTSLSFPPTTHPPTPPEIVSGAKTKNPKIAVPV
jgi:hypothetical protein